MFSKLDEVVKRYEELTARLEDPAVYSDPKKLEPVARERKGLQELVDTYTEYKETDREIAEQQELLKEDDRELVALIEEELPGLLQRKQELAERLKILLLPKDPLDEKNILLEIRAGTGGEEAALFVSDLLRMYLRFAESQGWQAEEMNQSPASAGGIKEAIIMLSGEAVYSHMKYEGGVHRVQRVPVTESQGRIHTSTVTVAVMPEADEVDIQLDEKDLEISVMRAGGPGGQSVNTTDSAVRMTHIPTGISVHCQDERSQIKNKAKARKILMARLLELEEKQRREQESAQRRSMVGTGERAEKIRTYNFPERRVTDHRINFTIYRLEQVLEGDLDELLKKLIKEERQKIYEAKGLA